jgi:signal transduction histidine kinase
MNREDLAVRLAEISASLQEAGSEEEVFERIGEHFRFVAWAIDGPVLRLRYTGWKEEMERAFAGEPKGDLVVHLDSQPVAPHLFSSRRFLRLPTGVRFKETILRAVRDGRGRPLRKEEIQAMLEDGVEIEGVQGPIFVSGAPWGLIAVEWEKPTEADLDLFTLFGAQVGAVLQILASRESLLRANRELRAIHTLAREQAKSGALDFYRPILESAAIVTESDAASLFLIDAEGKIRLVLHFGVPCAWAEGNVHGRDEIFERVVATMEPMAIEPREPDAPALALFPLAVERRTRGILVLARHEKDRAYTRQEIFRAGLLASQLAVQLENASLLEETRRQYELISGLYRVGNLFSHSHAGELPFKDALEILVDSLGYVGAWVYVVEDRGLVCMASAGTSRAPEPALVELDSESPLAVVVRSGELWEGPCVVSPETENLLVLPLVSSNLVVGCLAVGRDKEEPFQKHDVELLQSFGVQLALALERSRLVHSERDRVRQLRFLSEVGRITTSKRLDKEKLLPEFLRQMVDRIGFDSALAIDAERVHLHGEQPPDDIFEALQDLARSVAAGDSSAVMEMRWGERTAHLAAVPARSATGIQVMIALVRRSIPLSSQELETLEAAGSNLGFALEDAHRFATTKRNLDELELLLDIGQAVTSIPRLEELLETTAQLVNRLTEGTRTAIVLVDPILGQLRCEAVSNVEGARLRPGTVIPVDPRSLPKEPTVVDDVSTASRGLREAFDPLGVKSALAVHMHILDEPIGCIAIFDEKGPRRWPPATIERVRVIAHQLAIAVANARLHADLRASHRELARAQQELVEKERLAALGELSAVVAHEVRNPLGVIFNSLSSLRRLLHLEGDAKTLFQIVEEEANRLDRIVGDLLEFARPNPAHPSWVDLGSLVSSALATFPRPEKIALEIFVEPELPEVHVDARLLRQALLNLVQNAIHAMPKGGPLRVEVRKEEREGKTHVQLSVIDRGTGIPEELGAKIFDPFFTTKATGSGLGLALVKRIVEAHRGRLWFRSILGEGSTFTLEFEVPERKS